MQVRHTAAVSALGVALLLGAAGCADGHRAVADCGTPHLRWTLTRMADGGHPGDPAALLSARNTGTRPCALDGFPELDAQVGKAQGMESRPKRGATAPRVVLEPGHAAGFPVHYRTGTDRDGYCYITGDLDPALYVTPPHPGRGEHGTRIELTDGRGRHLNAQICSDTLELSPPDRI
ncbi:DUF4232 domain-containing protein [Streptomyces sp. NPDC127190]|uniref:DUF4232 domain-containing protein n=1 Tax=unclassified Streptomyces TaxID=2593676 RepID=UPI00364381AF